MLVMGILRSARKVAKEVSYDGCPLTGMKPAAGTDMRTYKMRLEGDCCLVLYLK